MEKENLKSLLKLFLVPGAQTLSVIIIFTSCFPDVLSLANVKIKISEPPSTTHFQSYSSSAKKLSLRTEPAPVSGPAHLQHLNGECFKGKEKGYEYTICPFQNVTQKEERSSWNSFHGVLGVWHEWIVRNGTLTGMHFTTGERCGMLDREVKVMLNCSTGTRVHSMSEPSTCSYEIWLDTPLACLEGAMQVFHLLSGDQLKAWNSFEEEYYRDEITFQGLYKQRNKILVEVGLLRPPKPPTEQPAVNVHSPLTVTSACEEEKKALENQLKHLQSKVEVLIRDYSSIARTIGFIPTNQTAPESSHPTNWTTISATLGKDSTTRLTGKEDVNITMVV